MALAIPRPFEGRGRGWGTQGLGQSPDINGAIGDQREVGQGRGEGLSLFNDSGPSAITHKMQTQFTLRSDILLQTFVIDTDTMGIAAILEIGQVAGLGQEVK